MVRNVKCQRMLIITIYKMSNASRWYPVTNPHQDHQGSRSEQLRTLVTFSWVAFVFSKQRRHVVWPTVASQCFQRTSVANFPTSFSFYSCVRMDGNPTFTVHATAHALRAAINLNSILLRQEICCLGNSLIFDGLTNFMLKWIWCGSEAQVYGNAYLGGFKKILLKVQFGKSLKRNRDLDKHAFIGHKMMVLALSLLN